MRTFRILPLLVTIGAALSAQQPIARATGYSMTGLPALNFDADEGFGYGALLQYYDYGDQGAEPYRYTLQPTVFLTTRGRRDLTLFLDAPHLLSGGWRLGAALAREEQLATPYYGIGNETVADPNATIGANPYYYRFGRTILRGSFDVQHQIGIPSLRVLLGAGIRSIVVDPVPYDSGTTLLAQAVGSATLPTTNAHYVRAGLVFDTRDREIGPRDGNWSELLVQHVGGVLAGDQKYTRITGSVRQYIPLTSSLTLAERVVMQTVHGDPSISELFTIQSSYKDDEALGGASSIRGIPKNRYVGKGVEFSNTELRWSAAEFSLVGHPSALILSAFADAGRVWIDGLDVSQIASDLHYGAGGGARLGIGPSFVVAADVGHSSQSTAAIYIGLGYLF